jgi:hypothetical protein
MTDTVVRNYRGYQLAAEQDEQGWRVSGIKHSWNKSTLPVGRLHWPDAAAALQEAKALVDANGWRMRG